jgi:hypothetical protein
MSVRSWLRKLVCPTCVGADADHPVIGMLERSAEGLDRIAEGMRKMQQTAADGPNPILGDRPIRVPRKEQRR